MAPLISVIIPTYNRAKFLADAITSIVGQTFPADQFEILVVDNNASDETKTVVAEMIARHSSHAIRYFFEPKRGSVAARNRGALEARGGILAYIDDDIRTTNNWLHAIDTVFQDPSVHIAGGRILLEYEVPPPRWLECFRMKHRAGYYLGTLGLLDLGDRCIHIDARFVWGGNFIIRREALFVSGGFHPDMFPKDLLHYRGDGETGLAIRAKQMGYKAWYIPEALVFHRVPKERMTYERFDNGYFRQGVSDSYRSIRNIFLDTGRTIKRRGMAGVMLAKSVETAKKQLRAMKHHFNVLMQRTDEEKALFRRFQNEYWKGYRFHQKAVKREPALLQWVLKKDYWDDTIPHSDFND